jgi:hypothetical protein
MTQVAIAPTAQTAEVFYLPHALIAEAEELLLEIRPLDRNSLGLALVSIYHQELDWLIQHIPKSFYTRHVLPELKSRRLACAITIERMQTPPS